MLVAIVLAVAALAASLARPRDDAGRESGVHAAQPGSPGAGSRAGRSPLAELAFDAGAPRRTLELEVGRAAVVSVAVPRAGQVELVGLGLSAPADPWTPAQFDVLVARPGRYELRFTPAGTTESSPAGTLAVGAR
jgi:hypothetical protein